MTTIEDFFFDLFREDNAKVGHSVLMRTLRTRIRGKLNPKEEVLLNEILDKHIEDGYYTCESQGSPNECFKLTQKGFDHIYLNHTKSIRQLEEIIWGLFRESRCKVGHSVLMRTLRTRIRGKLNPKEEVLLNEILDKHIEDGYYTCESQGSPNECFKLTQKGFDHIYLNHTKSIRQLEEIIWGLFRESRCKVGHSVLMRTLRTRIRGKLNPKEEVLLDEILDKHIEEGYYTCESQGSPNECFKLTQKGFDHIYKNHALFSV